MLRSAVEQRLPEALPGLHLPASFADVSNAARAVVAAYDGVAAQLLLDGDTAAARRWLAQLLGVLLNQ